MTPRHNVGGLDRWIRLMLGVPLIAAGLFPLGGAHGNVLGLLVALVGLASLVSGITGYCPLYVPLGISTKRPSTDGTTLRGGCRTVATWVGRSCCPAEGADPCQQGTRRRHMP